MRAPLTMPEALVMGEEFIRVATDKLDDNKLYISNGVIDAIRELSFHAEEARISTEAVRYLTIVTKLTEICVERGNRNWLKEFPLYERIHAQFPEFSAPACD